MSSLHNEQLLATSPNVVLIDTIGMFYPCDVNHSQHLMLYAFGSIIIVYNLQSNMKTFIKYHNTIIILRNSNCICYIISSRKLTMDSKTKSYVIFN